MPRIVKENLTRVIQVYRRDETIAFHRGHAVSWPRRGGRPVYTPVQTRLMPGERYRVRLLPRTHSLVRVLLAEDNRHYE